MSSTDAKFARDPREVAADLLRFIDASPTPFHCVAEAARQLEAAGFTRYDEADAWSLTYERLGYVIRGGGSIVAWRGGERPPAESGFRILGAHTDSPNLRLKPKPARTRHGHLQLDVEVYGGALVATWADRDLGLAGRVFVETDGGVEARLVRIDRPLCRIPNLAIHLNRKVNDEGLTLNKHDHLGPVLDLWSDDRGDPVEAVGRLLAEALDVEPERLLGHDLCLYDVTPGAFCGLDDAFVLTARLDNQAMCHAALSALLAAPAAEHTSVISLFDHEECGSESARGAQGTFLGDVLERLSGADESRVRALARSSQISADMAHAVHPNYADRHDGTHLPRMNGGPVIKTNNNQRYATDGETGALFRRVCRAVDVPVQEFVNRADLACGTTIGPISAARLGVRTVDVGNPMWSMHSVREMAGAADPEMMTRVMTAYLAGTE